MILVQYAIKKYENEETAIVINGKLEFTGVPKKQEIIEKLKI